MKNLTELRLRNVNPELNVKLENLTKKLHRKTFKETINFLVDRFEVDQIELRRQRDLIRKLQDELEKYQVKEKQITSNVKAQIDTMQSTIKKLQPFLKTVNGTKQRSKPRPTTNQALLLSHT